MTDFPALVDVQGKLKAKQDELGAIFAEAGPDVDLSKVKSVSGAADTKSVAEYIRNLNTECGDLAKEREALVAVQKAANYAAGLGERGAESGDGAKGAPASGEQKSFGELFTASDAFKSKGQMSELDVDLKTLMTTTAGWAPETTRSGLVVESAQRPVQVTDLIPVIPTTQSAYTYMEETTFTNNAAEAAEGGTYGEAALVLTEQSSTVRKVAVWLPVTDEQLEDEAGAGAYINQRLPFMIRQRLDSQILVGNGTAPNLRGVNNVVGIQTQAKGTDPVPDAIYKAMTLVEVTGRATPNAVVIHPTDWQDVRLLRTADGIYIWGNPSEVGPEFVWGLRVVKSDAQTLNTAVVGDWANYSLLAVRRGIEVQTTNSHGTFFIEGKQAIRADMRAALVFTRPAAFCTVTGI
jgi:HK97 family phage major capsid protein